MTPKAVLPHHRSGQGVITAQFGIQIIHHNRNVALRKPLWDYFELVIESLLLLYIRSHRCIIWMFLILDGSLAVSIVHYTGSQKKKAPDRSGINPSIDSQLLPQ